MNTTQLTLLMVSMEFPKLERTPSIEKLDIRPSEYKELLDSRMAAYRSAKEKYYAEREAAIKSWKAWLHKEHCPFVSQTVADKVYEMAWEHGHSSGYHEVEGAYEALALLATFAYEEGWNA